MNDQQIRQTHLEEGRYVVVESPVPRQRALAPRAPLALLLSGSALLAAVWYVAVIGSGGTAAIPAPPVTAVQSDPSTSASAVEQQPSALPPILQSRSSEILLSVATRDDGRTALSGSPSVLVVYVPDGYYPQPEAARPPTAGAAQAAASIVQEIATGGEANALVPARALRSEQPQYAAGLAAELQQLTAASPRYNLVRQILIELDPELATRAQVVAQTQVQAEPQTEAQTQPPVQVQAQSAPADAGKAARVYRFVMATVPAYLKLPLGLNEGTLQVNTMLVPTPVYLFNQQQVRMALCEAGGGEVVAVYDAVPSAWELSATFAPRDPVRWFALKVAGGQTFFLPNYLDPVRDMQVGDRFVNRGGCYVELMKR